MTSSLLGLDFISFSPVEVLPRSTELYPTIWLSHPSMGEQVLAPTRHWVSVASLDRYEDLPPVEVEVTPRRAIPKDWKAEAACHGMDLALFFGDDGSTRPALRRSVLSKAKDVCDKCPVARRCLTEALEKDERGIWGGTSRRKRKVFLEQIASGERTLEEVVDECLPIRPISLPASSLSLSASL